mmetsp:Transcript_88650/g.239863  ORF Transcript_88650/g.239863 Transcript_88650/m.239863 type:complete len:280 (+) Transcript_88650:105-944(+)
MLMVLLHVISLIQDGSQREDLTEIWADAAMLGGTWLLFGSGPNNSMSEFETNAAGNVMLGHTSSKFKPSAQPADHVFDKLMKAATAGTGSEALLLDLAAESDLEGPHRQSRTQTELRSQFVRPCLHEGRLVGHPGVAEPSSKHTSRISPCSAEHRADTEPQLRSHRIVEPSSKYSSRISPSSAEHRALPSAEAIASSHSSSGRAHRQGQRSEPHGRPTEAEPQLLQLPRHDRHQDLVPALDGRRGQWMDVSLNLAGFVASHRALEPDERPPLANLCCCH